MRAVGGQHPRLLHLQVQVVPLAGPLADPAEDRPAAVAHRDVVDQLLDDDGLADARAAEQPDLAALGERRDEVDDLDPGLEHLGLGLQLGELRRFAVDGPPLGVGRNRRAAVHRLAQHVEDPAQGVLADRHRDRAARVGGRHPADQPVGGGHRHRAHLVAADVLLHLGHQLHPVAVLPGTRLVDPERRVQLGQALRRELHVDDGTDDLDDLADVRFCHGILVEEGLGVRG